MLPNLQPGEMLIVLAVAVLLFGKRLPEVGRSLGKGIVEFKKGLRGIEDEFDPSATATSSFREPVTTSSDAPAYNAIPKFEPPTTAPSHHATFESTPTQA